MTHQTGKTCQCAAFHLKIGDAMAVIFKTFNLFVLLRISQWYAQFSALWTEKATAGDSYAPHHLVASYALECLFVSIDNVGSA